MIPHTLVLGPDLQIFKVHNGYWYWGRPYGVTGVETRSGVMRM